MIRCSKCGAKIPEDSKFCSSCGAKVELVEDIIYECSKCGNISKQKTAFCEECGSKLVFSKEEERVLAVEKRTVRGKEEESTIANNKKSVLEIIKVCIFSGIAILVSLLFIGSLFGDFLPEINFTILFDPNELINGGGFSIIFLVLFIVSLGLTLTFGTLTIVYAIISLVKKEERKFPKFLGILMISPLIYFIPLYVVGCIVDGEISDVFANILSRIPASGFSTYVVGFVFLLMAIIFRSIINIITNKDKKAIVPAILRIAAMFNAIFMISISFNYIAVLCDLDGGSAIAYSPISFFFSFCDPHSAVNTLTIILLFLISASTVVFLIYFANLFSSTCNVKKIRKLPFILSIVLLSLSIITIIIDSILVNKIQSSMVAMVSPTFIGFILYSLVGFGLCLADNIVFKKLSKKEINQTNN